MGLTLRKFMILKEKLLEWDRLDNLSKNIIMIFKAYEEKLIFVIVIQWNVLLIYKNIIQSNKRMEFIFFLIDWVIG